MNTGENILLEKESQVEGKRIEWWNCSFKLWLSYFISFYMLKVKYKYATGIKDIFFNLSVKAGIMLQLNLLSLSAQSNNYSWTDPLVYV